jgi:hypothetical protein
VEVALQNINKQKEARLIIVISLDVDQSVVVTSFSFPLSFRSNMNCFKSFIIFLNYRILLSILIIYSLKKISNSIKIKKEIK